MIVKNVKESDFETFKIKVEKLQKQAEKLGLEVPQYRVIGETYEQHPTIPHYMYKVVQLEIDDVNVTFDDWKVVCHIRRISPDLKIQGKIIGNAFYYPLEELPESCYEKAPTLCEHCGKNIPNRLLTFILRNEKTGEYKQVGSTCVKNFVSDHRNITSIINFLNDYTGYINNVPSGDFSNMRLYLPVKDVIKLSADILMASGWVSRWDASVYHKSPSIEVLIRRIDDDKWSVNEKVTDELIADIIKFHENKIIALSENETINTGENYLRNCSMQIINHSVEYAPKCLTYILSGVRDYFQQFIRKPTKNEFYGNEGEEFHDKFIVTASRPIENKFGMSLLITMVNHDGFGFKTFANVDTDFGKFMLDKQADFVFEADAKIKKHNEFKGRNETMLFYFKNFKEVEC